MTGFLAHDVVIDVIARVRSQRPLVHSLTNGVVMNWTANICLALGASPVMALAAEELVEICDLAQALNLNIGLLEAARLPSMLGAARLMRTRGKPVVFDPVGVGATAFRRAAALQILAEKPAILRANAGEIAALANSVMPAAGFGPQRVAVRVRGVDSCGESQTASQMAHEFATQQGLVIVMTGAADIITDGRRLARISGGTAGMTQVTGGGCALSAIVAACAGIEPDPWLASIAACAFYKGAAARAGKQAAGPGTLAMHLLDAMAHADIAATLGMVRIETEDMGS